MDYKRLYRQVHPKHVKDGIVTSQAFTPMNSSRLSVYDGSMIDAKSAWKHCTKRYQSAGVMAITDMECKEQNLDVISDSKSFKGHVNIDFGDCSRSMIKRIARILTNRARERGWYYRPNSS